MAVGDFKPVDMPERILAVEMAVVGMDVAALLDGAFAVGDGYVMKGEMMAFKQGALSAQLNIIKCFHCCFLFVGCKIMQIVQNES